jgi:uncharacterized protein (TIGR00375 family)
LEQLQLLGLVDAVSPRVLKELDGMLAAGELIPVEGGGLRRGGVTIIPGAEVELSHPAGPAHYLLYFPDLPSLKAASGELGRWITNPNLSSQRCRLRPDQLVELALRHGGVVALAHAFTPHKGFYGSVATRLGEIFAPEWAREIKVVELGLSSDTSMADRIAELHSRAFISNSDAHSPGKIGREYNLFLMEDPNFEDFKLVLAKENGRQILGNYGLDPRLGKYHRTFCNACGTITGDPPPVLTCHACGAKHVVVGVLDRITLLADAADSPPGRPPYVRQVPLEFIPGVGQVLLNKLIAAFGSEMAILHDADPSELEKVAGPVVAQRIILSQKGQLGVEAGGGGIYGRVKTTPEP